jgi:hypothetical protein
MIVNENTRLTCRCNVGPYPDNTILVPLTTDAERRLENELHTRQAITIFVPLTPDAERRLENELRTRQAITIFVPLKSEVEKPLETEHRAHSHCRYNTIIFHLH